jgi:hypothetical protein
MAAGAPKVPNSISSTMKTRTTARAGRTADRGKTLLLFGVDAAVDDAYGGRETRAPPPPCEPCSMPLPRLMPSKRPVTPMHALQIFAVDFDLAGFVLETRQRAEGGILAGGTDDHRVLDVVERGARVLGKTDADGIGAVVDDDRRGGRLTLQDGAGVEFDFLGGETGAGGYDGIDAHDDGGTADGVLDAVLHVFDGFDFLDAVGHFRPPFLQQRGILREELDLYGLGRTAEIADLVLQDLDEFDIELRVFVVDFLAYFRRSRHRWGGVCRRV